MPITKLIQGDCFNVMTNIPDRSMDMILTDPPYGTTACKWDTPFDLDTMWAQFKRVTKPNGAIVMTGSQPFTSKLVMSNPNMFKYCWVWDKVRPSGFQIAKHRPMMRHEDVVVFSNGGGKTTYNRQMEKRDKPVKGKVVSSSDSSPLKYSDRLPRKYTHKNPQSILVFNKGSDGQNIHPTQKPVALMEYLIKTYTNEGDLVLDPFAGSGTTGVACINLVRDYILIEKETEYVDIIKQRLKKVNENL